jgi:hypothetical protein
MIPTTAATAAAKTMTTANPMFHNPDLPLAQMKINDTATPNAQAAAATISTTAIHYPAQSESFDLRY